MKNSGLHKWSKILVLILDILLINLSAFLALLLRYEFDFSRLSESGFLDSVRAVAIPGTLVCLLALMFFHVYSNMWKYASSRELLNVAFASLTGAGLFMLTALMFQRHLPRSFPVLFAMVLFLLVCASRFLLAAVPGRNLGLSYFRFGANKDKKRTMLIGAGDGAAMLIKEFNSSGQSHNDVICAIDDDTAKHGRRVRGVKVIGGREQIAQAVEKFGIEEIIFCIPSASVHDRNELLSLCNSTGAKLKTMPSLSQLANGEISVNQIKEVSIEDLLGRTQVCTDNSAAAPKISGKTVLVTGGGGSIGSELCRQIARLSPERLIIFDIYENNAYDIQQELIRTCPELNLTVLIGSVRDVERVNYIFDKYRPDLVCHAAAHKHVPLMEDSPAEAIKNNVFGTYNVAKAAGEFGTKWFILISTDKAVNPTNVMGATKRLCEMVVQSMNALYSTEYMAVRFGNVLGSNGSVIPLFKKQIAQGGPVTVTDKRITRFFMTIPEAVSLILQAGAFAEGGEVFVLDMGQPVRIDDMARKMIRLSGFEPDVDIKIEYTGLRPGEKLYEELLLATEGLQKTDNELIYIGHQRMYSIEEIHQKLELLKEVLRSEKEEVRQRVMNLIQEDADPHYQVIAEEEYA